MDGSGLQHWFLEFHSSYIVMFKQSKFANNYWYSNLFCLHDLADTRWCMKSNGQVNSSKAIELVAVL